jgi:hypothetical protein
MPETEYRLFFNNTAASQELLETIGEVTVEQEVDMAWEARLQIPLTVDARGNWQGGAEDYMQPFSRLRVEVKVGDEPFVPLFDGPITGFDSQMNSEPGQSTLTLIAQDDTFFMNRMEQVSAFENRLDHEVAQQIFTDFRDFISNTRVETTPASGSALAPLVVQRGTAMDILRVLAKRQGMHVYVLPGENPGQSIGCFKAFPISPDGLPPLILLGAQRNIDSLQVRYCACKPADTTAATLKITDKQVVTETSRSSDVEMMGDEQEEGSLQPALQLLPPQQGESIDLRQAVFARAAAASYAYQVSGHIMEETYAAVLQPYQVVTVQAGNTPVSGDYLIAKATHKITRANYSQSFELKRNARSSRFSAGGVNVPGGIF